MMGKGMEEQGSEQQGKGVELRRSTKQRNGEGASSKAKEWQGYDGLSKGLEQLRIETQRNGEEIQSNEQQRHNQIIFNFRKDLKE